MGVSGIAGIIRFDGATVEAQQIAKITGAMANRGPDGIYHWIAGSVALGHCMLRTTTESLEEIQPLTNNDKSVTLVMDGRLDNREELKQELIGRGIAIKGLSDAELVLGAYELWGDDSPGHLLGDFTFAAWDARRQKLFCARDHVGAKLIFYFCSKTFLVFASDEEAFFALPEVPRQPNEDCIIEMLVPSFNGYDEDASCLKGIVTLPPGKTLSVRRTGQKVIRTYWQLEPQQESRFASDRECEEAFRWVFSEAVRRRIRTLGNPTLMLSGGIDSAAVAGAAYAMQSNVGVKLQTYSVVSEEITSCIETRNIRSIIKGHESQAHQVAIPSFDSTVTIDDLKTAVWTHAQPTANTMPLLAMMYMAAARDGHRVMLDGIDGDLATYTPARYVSYLLRSGSWRDFWRECRQARLNHTYLRYQSLPATLCKSAWDVFTPSSVKRLKRAIFSGSPYMSSLINPDFAEYIDVAGKLRDRQGRGRAVSYQEQHIRALFPGISNGMAGVDRLASRYGIEARHPWSDKSLLEFYVRLPLCYKAREGWTKYLVRKATAPWLDDKVRWNKEKDHLGRRFVRPLLSQSKQEIMYALAMADNSMREFVDMGRLVSLSRRYESAEDYELWELYNIITLALWLNRLKRRGS